MDGPEYLRELSRAAQRQLALDEMFQDQQQIEHYQKMTEYWKHCEELWPNILEKMKTDAMQGLRYFKYTPSMPENLEGYKFELLQCLIYFVKSKNFQARFLNTYTPDLKISW